MAAKIHHATAKKAKSLGIVLTIDDSDGSIVASKDGTQLASHLSGSVALEQAIVKLNGGTAPKAVKLIKPKAARKAATRKAKVARKKARRADADEGDEFDGEDEGDDDEGKSIVKHKYKQAYRPFKHTCGDEFADRIGSVVKVQDEDGKLRIDPVRLRRLATNNGVWNPDYRKLNVGQQRMNVGNRLRAKDKAGDKIVWSA